MKLLVSMLLTACGSETASAPDAPIAPRETITTPITLRASDIVEGTLTGGADDLVVIEIDAPSPKLDWNIHGHADGETQVIREELGVMSIRFTFRPPAQAAWSLLLRNQDLSELPLAIKLELFANMQWDGP